MYDQKLDAILAKVSRIEGALYPDPGQPSRVTALETDVSSLKAWRNFLTGAWAVVTAIFALLFGWKSAH